MSNEILTQVLRVHFTKTFRFQREILSDALFRYFAFTSDDDPEVTYNRTRNLNQLIKVEEKAGEMDLKGILWVFRTRMDSLFLNYPSGSPDFMPLFPEILCM